MAAGTADGNTAVRRVTALISRAIFLRKTLETSAVSQNKQKKIENLIKTFEGKKSKKNGTSQHIELVAW